MALRSTRGNPSDMRLAGLLDTPVRKLVHDPYKILAGLVEPGQRVLDVGCGPGYFTLPMAEMVGSGGLVYAADIQQKMLDRLDRRARARGLDGRIRIILNNSGGFRLEHEIDFALAFFMLHEAAEPEELLKDIYDNTARGGRLLLCVPKMVVPAGEFADVLQAARGVGFEQIEEPRIWLSRSALMRR